MRLPRASPDWARVRKAGRRDIRSVQYRLKRGCSDLAYSDYSAEYDSHKHLQRLPSVIEPKKAIGIANDVDTLGEPGLLY